MRFRFEHIRSREPAFARRGGRSGVCQREGSDSALRVDDAPHSSAFDCRFVPGVATGRSDRVAARDWSMPGTLGIRARACRRHDCCCRQPAVGQKPSVSPGGSELSRNPPIAPGSRKRAGVRFQPAPPSRHCSPSREERVRSSSDDHPIAGSPHQAEWAASSPASLAPSRARQTGP